MRVFPVDILRSEHQLVGTAVSEVDGHHFRRAANACVIPWGWLEEDNTVEPGVLLKVDKADGISETSIFRYKGAEVM